MCFHGRQNFRLGMGNFFAELNAAHLYRVAAGYAVVASIDLPAVNNVACFQPAGLGCDAR